MKHNVESSPLDSDQLAVFSPFRRVTLELNPKPIYPGERGRHFQTAHTPKAQGPTTMLEKDAVEVAWNHGRMQISKTAEIWSTFQKFLTLHNKFHATRAVMFNYVLTAQVWFNIGKAGDARIFQTSPGMPVGWPKWPRFNIMVSRRGTLSRRQRRANHIQLISKRGCLERHGKNLKQH